MTFDSGRLWFQFEVIKQMFNEALDTTVHFMNTVIGDLKLHGTNIDTIALVGGFTMSSFMTEGIREKMLERKIPVIRPEQPGLAVLKGAVLFGRNEHIFVKRVMRYTYGLCIMDRFDKQKHKKDCKHVVEKNGEKWVKNVFHKHVTKDQSVTRDAWIAETEYKPDNPDQTKVNLVFFASDKTDPVFVTDGCFCIGQFEIEFPKSKKASSSQVIKVALKFGDTEIEARCLVQSTGETVIQKLVAAL